MGSHVFELAKSKASGDDTAAKIQQLKKDIVAREQLLLPVYHQVR